MASVSLKKGQRVSLKKKNGNPLLCGMVGLGWDPVKKSGGGGFLSGLLGGGSNDDEIDLDASIGMFDAGGSMIDVVYYPPSKHNSKCGSLHHHGDNRTGEGEGDDEKIDIDFTRIPANVQTLVVTVSSFTGQTFDDVENAFVRMVDDQGNELVRYDLSDQGAYSAMVMMKIYRKDGEWKVQAIGALEQGATIHKLADAMARYV
ncbi:TerD family protein [Patescibacteria group bacterium]